MYICVYVSGSGYKRLCVCMYVHICTERWPQAHCLIKVVCIFYLRVYINDVWDRGKGNVPPSASLIAFPAHRRVTTGW